MSLLGRLALVGGMLLGWVTPALGAPFWVAWEGDDRPESVGYTRSWGNWQGPGQGGAIRTLENGVLTYDSLYDPGVWDSYYMANFPFPQPAPGEVAVMEWRLRIDHAYAGGDPGVGLTTEDGWTLSYMYAEDRIRISSENYLEVPFAPYVWHDYRVVSVALRAYDLFIDGTLAHEGSLELTFPGSDVGFGDVGQNFMSGSLHHWDYFRFGIVAVPETSTFSLSLFTWLIVWRGARHGPLPEPCREREVGGLS
jgi:hypothetical protein